MYELFEEIFWEVADEMGINDWWVLYDSEDFDIVETRIGERLGVEVLDSDEFAAWYNEMAWEL